MKPINITSMVKKYGPGYVAKHPKTGKVFVHARRIDLLLRKMGRRTDLIVSWIPRAGARYVF